MTVKIKISYQHDHELQQVIKHLLPLGITFKVAKRQQGQFKNAYVHIKHEGFATSCILPNAVTER